MTLNLRYKQGERIIVTLTNGEIVEGEYDGGTEDRIDIFNAKQYPECSVYPGLLSYYKTEIQTITLFKEESVDENNSSTGKSSPNKQAENEESQKIIRIPKLEYERLKELSLQYTYFATPDRRYLEAVEYLNSCENVGVVGIGSERGRLDMIHLLVMSSWDKVYIIDLLQFRRSKFPEELKGILESDDIKKIVHNSRTLVDCLHHRHQVNLKNIFDVQVADFLISKREGKDLNTMRNMSEILHSYLNFPSTLLEKPLKVKHDKWIKRPVKDSRRIFASQLATYLITIKNYLERIMLKEYYEAVDCYSMQLKQLTLYSATQSASDRGVPDELKNLVQ